MTPENGHFADTPAAKVHEWIARNDPLGSILVGSVNKPEYMVETYGHIAQETGLNSESTRSSLEASIDEAARLMASAVQAVDGGLSNSAPVFPSPHLSGQRMEISINLPISPSQVVVVRPLVGDCNDHIDYSRDGQSLMMEWSIINVDDGNAHANQHGHASNSKLIEFIGKLALGGEIVTMAGSPICVGVVVSVAVAFYFVHRKRRSSLAPDMPDE